MDKNKGPRKAKSKTPERKTTATNRVQKSNKNSEDVSEIFSSIRNLMLPYQKSFVPRINSDRAFDLWSEKDVVIAGRPRKEVYFAGLVIQSNYVGFYFMPVYATEEFRDVFKEDELLQTLKGKSCFHIRKNDPQLLRQIKDALKLGYDIYKKKGWVRN